MKTVEELKVSLKSGDYNGVDLMQAWCTMENQQTEIIRLKSVIQQAIDNFGYRTGKFDKLLSYAKQELEVRQLMDGLNNEK